MYNLLLFVSFILLLVQNLYSSIVAHEFEAFSYFLYNNILFNFTYSEATTVAPVVEKEVEEVSTPKVAAEDTEVVGNGTSAAKVGDEAAEAVPTPAEASENGQKTPAADEAVAADATAESKPAENTEESAEKEADTVESEQKNGSSTGKGSKNIYLAIVFIFYLNFSFNMMF